MSKDHAHARPGGLAPRAVAMAALLLAALTLVALRPAPAQAQGTAPDGGPVVLDGMDPFCHSTGEGTGAYIAAVLEGVHGQVANAGSGIAVIGEETTNPCGAQLGESMTQWIAGIDPVPAVTYHGTAAAVTQLLADIADGTTTPAVIYVPDDWGRGADVEQALTEGARRIAGFVNDGGGLFASYGTFGWLTALLPQAEFVDGGCNGGPEVTPAGQAAFPALTDEIVQACWHGSFAGQLGGLDTLVDWPYPDLDSPRVPVAIGGASVTLPGALSLAATDGPVPTGIAQDVTATLLDGMGSPLADTVVDFAVDGPGTPTSGSGTTDAQGQTTFTTTATAAGVATITATATVDGSLETATTTLDWRAAPGAPRVTVTGGDTTATITVLPASDDAAGAAAGFRVTVQPGDQVHTLPAEGGTVSLTGLANGETYTITTVATSDLGDGPATAQTVTPRVPAPPRPPTPAPTPAPAPVAPPRAVPVTIPVDSTEPVLVTVPLPAGSAGRPGAPAAPVGTVLLSGAAGSGYVEITPQGVTAGPTGARGFGLAFDVHVEGLTFDGAELCLPYDPDAVRDWGVAPDALDLFHLVDAAWDPITTAVHADDDMICGTTTSFSPFVIGVDMAPRWAGADRVATAVIASQRRYDAGVPAVVLATGDGYADALAGGPVAAALGGPVLLTTGPALPEAVADELARLQPQRLLVLGGASAVADDVLAAASAAAGVEAERIGGASRYDTAAAAALDAFPEGSGRAYVATGAGFADALAGGAAAAVDGAPVLLVDPTGVPAATTAALRELGVEEVILLGGEQAVDDRTAGALAHVVDGPVTRLSGGDRYATAAAIARHTAPEGAAVVFVATGEGYADALAAAPAAGGSGAPLLLVRPGDVPEVTAEALEALAPTRLVVLGGPGAIADDVLEALRSVL